MQVSIDRVQTCTRATPGGLPPQPAQGVRQQHAAVVGTVTAVAEDEPHVISGFGEHGRDA